MLNLVALLPEHKPRAGTGPKSGNRPDGRPRWRHARRRPGLGRRTPTRRPMSISRADEKPQASTALPIALPCPAFYVRWGTAVLTPKGEIEVGQITEPRIQCDGANGTCCEARVGQHLVGAGQPLFEHEFRKCRPLCFKQNLEIARRYFLESGHGMDVQIQPAKIIPDKSARR